MLIVSDTGPLRYLIEINAINVLTALYGNVVTTDTVIAELQLPNFPISVWKWAQQPPSWLVVAQPKRIGFLDQLDPGEASALSLAIERGADALLIDERQGSAIARTRGFRTIGTLAVLQEAGHAQLINFYDAIRKLTHETAFRHTRSLIEQVISDFEARK